MILVFFVSLLFRTVLCSINDVDKTQFEAAFQGRCGRDSPCEQLCYELHDGMFECDCKQGFLLHQDGYSCIELNTTMETLREDMEFDDGEDVLYQKDASFSAELVLGPVDDSTPPSTPSSGYTQSSNDFRLYESQNKTLRGVTETVQIQSTSAPPCPMDNSSGVCPDVRIPRFTGQGWLAFAALKAAYKNVQLEIEFRPEAWDGIIFLTGERDDLTGDFMALLMYQGFVEFRFDCGSGVGVVRSLETVLLNQWNKITLYRHKWDAWIQLNSGKHVQGRSKGLFSRMTFREPVFIGGKGNTSGLQDKLPTDRGLKGCVRHLQINDHIYNFALFPKGDAVQGSEIHECEGDRCSKVPCQHGGKCVASEETAICLCPLGFTGDLCETRLELQIPSFNGSSYLRYVGLGSSVLSWLDITVVMKTHSPNGLVLYNGHRADGMGDFIALYLHEGHIEFAFDLGTGTAILRSAEPISLGDWHEIRISRTGRLAVLQIDKGPAVQILSPGAFTQLYLPMNMFVGGITNIDMISPKVKSKSFFVGCIQKISVNNHPIKIFSDALAGVNIDNCPHPCAALPCGDRAQCIPLLDTYKCSCERNCKETNVPEVAPIASFTSVTFHQYTDPDIVSRISRDKLSINMRFRTTASSGLILWTGQTETTVHSPDFLALGIRDGYLHLGYNLGSGETNIAYNTTKVDDGAWHRVRVTRNEQEGGLAVDSGNILTVRSPGKLKQLNTNTGLLLGGMEDIIQTTHYKYHNGFNGCVSELTLNSDYHVKLSWFNGSSNHCVDIPH